MTQLSIDLELPDHTKEINNVNEYINKLKKEIIYLNSTRELNKENYERLYNNITQCLYYVADLSDPAFKVRDKLEDEYFKIYKHSPELSRILFLKHYKNIHDEYNKLKNKLFKLYDMLIDFYIRINKTPPPV